MRIWEKDSFRRVAVAVSDRLSSDATLKLSVLGSVVAALGSLASHAVVSGGSHVLAGIYDDYLGSGYDCKQVPILLHQTFDELPANVSSSVFGTVEPFSMMKFIITGLKAAEHHDRVISRSGFCRDIFLGEVSMPLLAEVFSNIVGVWPLIVVYVKEIGERTGGDNLVV